MLNQPAPGWIEKKGRGRRAAFTTPTATVEMMQDQPGGSSYPQTHGLISLVTRIVAVASAIPMTRVVVNNSVALFNLHRPDPDCLPCMGVVFSKAHIAPCTLRSGEEKATSSYSKRWSTRGRDMKRRFLSEANVDQRHWANCCTWRRYVQSSGQISWSACRLSWVLAARGSGLGARGQQLGPDDVLAGSGSFQCRFSSWTHRVVVRCMDVGESGGGLTEGRAGEERAFYLGFIRCFGSLFGVEGRVLEARESEGDNQVQRVVNPTARL